MTKKIKSYGFEKKFVSMVKKHIGTKIPSILPKWMIDEGIEPGAKIISVNYKGNKNPNNKTDVIINLSHGKPIKVSIKLGNAGYMGNWYGHKRFLKEFGIDKFNKMTELTTQWANNYAKTVSNLFVGVSISFGKRSGETCQDFLDVFDIDDIFKIAKGFGQGDHVANCMYIANDIVDTIPDLINELKEITIKRVNEVTENLKIIYRPVYIFTNRSNLSKNVYTRFLPYRRLPNKKIIDKENATDLFELGHFVTVEPNSLNHNNILDNLEKEYNIFISRIKKK